MAYGRVDIVVVVVAGTPDSTDIPLDSSKEKEATRK